MTLDQLNAADVASASAALARCCGARTWVDGMLAARPFAGPAACHAAATRLWNEQGEAAWLEAFAHHPRIGDAAALHARFASTAQWAGGEQSGVAAADEATLASLAEGNRAYEERFGHVFIVCATGLGADEMLARLRSRLGNGPQDELRIAAAEQLKITHLRLDKLLGGSS